MIANIYCLFPIIIRTKRDIGYDMNKKNQKK